MHVDRQREVEHLGQADRHIAEGETRISEQQVRLVSLRERGFDAALAERLLEALECTLTEWRAHREAILRRLDTIDAAGRLPVSRT